MSLKKKNIVIQIYQISGNCQGVLKCRYRSDCKYVKADFDLHFSQTQLTAYAKMDKSNIL